MLIAQLDAMHSSRGGDWFYRTFVPTRALAELPGVYGVSVDQAHRRLPAILERAEVLVINGVCNVDLLPVVHQRKRQGLVTVFEINDDVQQMQASNPLSRFFAHAHNIRLFRRLALTADGVQYSVEELERLYGSLNRRGRVFHNQLVSVPPLRSPAGPGVNVGWGGSAGHLEDMAAIAPALIEWVLREPSVTLQLMCSERIWGLFAALPAERKQLTPVGSIERYYEFVSTLDIGIAPNRDAGFNRARSDVKFLEYAGYGAVAVVQRLTPYLGSVRHGDNGFLFGDVTELTETLSRLVADAAERQRVRARAHRYVVEERLQAGRTQERLDFYAELAADRREGAGAELFAELAGLEGAEVSGRHCVLGHTRFEKLLHDGLVALRDGAQREQGLEHLREAARLEPEHGLPPLLLGATLHQEEALVTALSRNPRSLQATLDLGLALLARGEPRLALQRFLAGAELAPGYEMPYAHAAVALERAGASKEARELEQLAHQLAAPVTPLG